MQVDAEARLQRFLEENADARLEWEQKQKLRHDPRITPLGRLIRKYSLDELPQFLNVLRGEMSLVGPRPMLMDQRRQYPGTAYFAMRPGLTGSWQVGDRNECSFAERARHDNRYAASMSFTTDLRILMLTPLAHFAFAVQAFRMIAGLFKTDAVPKPEEVQETLSAALRTAMKDEALRRRFAELATEPATEERASIAFHRRFLAEEVARWRPIIQAAGVYAD